MLDSLAASLAKAPNPTDAELLAYAAIEALGASELRASAIEAGDAAAKGLERAPSGDTLSALATNFARDAFGRGELDRARAWLEIKSTALLKLIAAGKPNESARIRKRAYAAVAQDAARARDLAALLDYLGRIADTPSPGVADPPLGPLPAILDELLAKLASADRFEILRRWSLPEGRRNLVRILISPVQSWSTIDRLIDSAREAGKLDALAAELDPLERKRVPNAEPAMLLVAIARGKGAEVRERIVAGFARKRSVPVDPRNPAPTTFPALEYAVAKACLSAGELESEGKAFLESILKDERSYPRPFIASIHRDLETRDASRRQADRTPEREAWIATTQQMRSDRLTGVVPALWTIEADRIVHKTGSARDLLFFAYPLEGTFEIALEASATPMNSGRVAYGGLVFEPTIPGPVNALDSQRIFLGDRTPTWPNGPSRVSNLSAHESSERVMPALKSEGFNAFRIAVESKRLRMYMNDNLYYEEHGPISSPWLALAGFLGGRAEYRNLKISGDPRVASEVNLIAGGRLEGWSAAAFAESVPDRLSNRSLVWIESNSGRTSNRSRVAPGTPDDERDWHFREGEIIGKKNRSPRYRDGTPSLLQYVRPLGTGENWLTSSITSQGNGSSSPRWAIRCSRCRARR